MIRTQIQLPDPLYAELREIATQRDWSLAEAVRRGVELLVASYPRDTIPEEEWQFPSVNLGPFLAPVDEWRELANEREP